MAEIIRCSVRLVAFMGTLTLILPLPLVRAETSGEIPFEAGVVITAVADYATSVYAADVDGDGDLDVLSASADDNKIAWYENDGGSPPAFTSRLVTTAASHAYSVYAADVDGDSDMDILSASADDNKIAWYENNGGSPPAFTSHTITTTADRAVSVYAADVDGDGDLDVLSASAGDNKIAWYENDGGSPPAFTSHTITTVAYYAQSVYAGDVDGDGDLDVLSASANDDKIAWYENDGGSPPTFTSHTITTSADSVRSVYAADVDGDGDLDILSASVYDNKVAWYENNGGAPPFFTSHTITTSADYARSVYAADVDGDGDLDVLSASADDNKIAWYENDGTSPPAFTGHTIATSAQYAMWVYAADLDGDGDLDVLSASATDDTIAWYPNQAIHRSAFYPTQAHAVISDIAGNAYSVSAADVNGDGDLDILAACNLDDEVVWYENDGGSPPIFTRHIISANADAPSSVYAADMDGDGDLDVLSASFNDDKIAWYENDGGAHPTFTDYTITTSADGAESVYAADVNGDGDLDALSASWNDDTIAWYENDGGAHPAFTSRTITTSADGAKSVYAADVDGDGDLDVLSASQWNDAIAWYENDGGSPPAFTSRTITTSADGAWSVYTADLDDDGDLDVLSASINDDKIAWYENNGGSPPTFTSRTISTSADSARSVYAADVDSDGDLDVLSASFNDDKIAWYENDGGAHPTFTSRTVASSADGAESVYATDVNSDGDLDALSASWNDNTVAWYENRGGQFALATTDTAPATIAAGQRDDLLRIVAAHRGRPGDTDVELATFVLLFEENAGYPLTTTQANNLIENLYVYRDNGSGSFEPGADTLVATVSTLSLVAGRQTVALADADPNVRVAFGAPVTCFVVVHLTGNADGYTPHQFRVTHLTDPSTGSGSASTAEDYEHDLSLLLEYVANVSSRVITITPAPLAAPTLYAISNPDVDGNYVVDWSDASGATGYTLQEDDTPTFSNPTIRYSGPDSQYTVSGQMAGTWYYRVMASNAEGDGPWSNTNSVTVQARVYLPLVLRDYMAYFEGPWEKEDNDSYAEANGPLRSGRDYYGYPDDVKDYFSVYLRTAGSITVDLTNHTGQGVQLQLFYQSVDNRVACVLYPPYHIEYPGMAGLYYIYIYTASGYNDAKSYTLRVVY